MFRPWSTQDRLHASCGILRAEYGILRARRSMLEAECRIFGVGRSIPGAGCDLLACTLNCPLDCIL